MWARRAIAGGRVRWVEQTGGLDGGHPVHWGVAQPGQLLARFVLRYDDFRTPAKLAHQMMSNKSPSSLDRVFFLIV